MEDPSEESSSFIVEVATQICSFKEAMTEKDLAAKELSALGLDAFYKQYVFLPPAAVTSSVQNLKITEPMHEKRSIFHMFKTTRYVAGTKLLHASLQLLKDTETISARQVIGVPHLNEIDKGLLSRMGDHIGDMSTQNKTETGATLLPVVELYVAKIRDPFYPEHGIGLTNCEGVFKGKFIKFSPLQPAQVDIQPQDYNGNGDDSADDEVRSYSGSSLSDISDEEVIVVTEMETNEPYERRIPIYLKHGLLPIAEMQPVAFFTLIHCKGYWTLAQRIKQARPQNIRGEDMSVDHILWPWGLTYSADYASEGEEALDPISDAWIPFSNRLCSVVMTPFFAGNKIEVDVQNQLREPPLCKLLIPKTKVKNYEVLLRLLSYYAAGYSKMEPLCGLTLEPWPMGSCVFTGEIDRVVLTNWQNEVERRLQEEEAGVTDSSVGEVVEEDDGAANLQWSQFLQGLEESKCKYYTIQIYNAQTPLITYIPISKLCSYSAHYLYTKL